MVYREMQLVWQVANLPGRGRLRRYMIDMPIPVRAIDSDAHGQARPGLSEAALMVLAQEVVTRLAQWASDSVARRTKAKLRVQPDLDRLCAALIGPDPKAAGEMLFAAHARGATHEELCLFHVGDSALQLGRMWDNDDISFQDMALAAGRMLHILRDLREIAPPFEPRGNRSALFATVPGERHVLGITIAADVFRDAGWEVDLRLGLSEVELNHAIRVGGYPIVGFSASSAERIRALGRVVVESRLASPKALIFVGGNVARLEPDIALRVGADAAGWRMEDCKARMEDLYTLLPGLMSAK